MNSAAYDLGSNRDQDVIHAPSHRRHRKAIIESDPEDEMEIVPPIISRPPPSMFGRIDGSTPTYSMDTDISTLETPTFSTLNQSPSLTMMGLRWDHPVNLIGKKVVNPILHDCDKCLRPILTYGRLLPCKHVLCYNCANSDHGSQCGRCGGKITGVEKTGLGSIFMCSHGGSKYGKEGCRRTYLSERGLQAHIQFRHLKEQQQRQQQQPQPPNVPSAGAVAAATAALVNAAAAENHQRPPKMRPFPQNFSQPPPNVRASNSNLITVPMRDSGSWPQKPNLQQPPPNYYYAPPPTTTQNNSGYSDWSNNPSRTMNYQQQHHRR